MEQKLEARLRPMQGRVAGMILMLAAASGRVSAQTHNYAYVALHDRNRIAVLDADTGGLDANIPVGREPIDVAFSPDRTRAYVANSFSGTVSIINVLTQEPIGAVDVGAAVGAAPYAVATTPDGRFAYVATYAPDPPGGSDRLAVIDTVSVVGTVAVGRTPSGVAISPDGTFAYVTNSASHNVSVLNATQNPPVVIATIDLGTADPAAVAIAPNQSFAYVAAGISGAPQNALWVINTQTHEVTQQIDLGPLNVPARFIFTANSSRAYVPVSHEDIGGGAFLKEIDTSSHQVTRSLTLGEFGQDFMSWAVGLNSNESQAFVTGGALVGPSAPTNVVWIVDTNTLQVVQTRSVEESPVALAMADLPRPPNPRVVCVTHSTIDGWLTLIGSDTFQVLDVIQVDPVGGALLGLALRPSGDLAFVANYSTRSVAVVNVASRTVVNRIQLGLSPTFISISHDGKYAFVGGPPFTPTDDNLALINTELQTIEATLSTRFGPTNVAFTPDGERAYVTEFTTHELSVIDMTSRQVVATLDPDLETPGWVAVSPDGTFAYVSSYCCSDIAVIDTDPQSPTYHQLTRVNVGGQPGVVAFNPEGNIPGRDFAYLKNGQERLLVISNLGHREVGSVRVQSGPLGIAFRLDSDFAFLTDSGSNTVSVVDTRAQVIVATIPVRGSPLGVAAH